MPHASSICCRCDCTLPETGPAGVALSHCPECNSPIASARSQQLITQSPKEWTNTVRRGVLLFVTSSWLFVAACVCSLGSVPLFVAASKQSAANAAGALPSSVFPYLSLSVSSASGACFLAMIICELFACLRLGTVHPAILEKYRASTSAFFVKYAGIVTVSLAASPILFFCGGFWMRFGGPGTSSGSLAFIGLGVLTVFMIQSLLVLRTARDIAHRLPLELALGPRNMPYQTLFLLLTIATVVCWLLVIVLLAALQSPDSTFAISTVSAFLLIAGAVFACRAIVLSFFHRSLRRAMELSLEAAPQSAPRLLTQEEWAKQLNSEKS